MFLLRAAGNGRINVIARITSIWQRLNDSLWFIPAIVVLGMASLAVTLVQLSALFDSDAAARYPRLFGASAESSRSMLSTIAGSMVTVAGVTFSVMVVAVSQASSQYTPRVMRNFMRDRLSQLTLGVLVGVFVYCLIVLRTIRDGDDPFIPGLAVFASMLLALLAVALLMYFIHHIASTLEAGRILDSIARETLRTVDRAFPEPSRDETDLDPIASPLLSIDAEWHGIPAHRSGYIQHLDIDGLLRTAAQCNAVMRMDRAVGEFVAQGTRITSIAGHPADDDVVRSVNDQYVIDSYRTVFQDPSFGIRQMVDIALKALSPGVNDSTTAVACIDYLTAVLVRIASRRIPSSEKTLDGKVRVITRAASFEDMLDEAFSEIRRSASGNLRVLVRAVGALEVIVGFTRSPDRRAALLSQLGKFREMLEQLPGPATECKAAMAGCERVQALIQQSTEGSESQRQIECHKARSG